MKQLIVESIDALLDTLQSESSKRNTILLLFTGSNDSSTKSWCPDCNTADPVIHQVINDEQYNSDDYLFITVYVGQRDVWKDAKNVFRTHKDLRIKCVPTLMKWRSSLRLEESQCADKELIEMLIQE